MELYKHTELMQALWVQPEAAFVVRILKDHHQKISHPRSCKVICHEQSKEMENFIEF